MSTIAPPPSLSPPANPAWVPSPLYRLTVEKYEAMVAPGALTRHDQVHLINGYLVVRMTQNPPHMIANEWLGAELARVLPAALYQARAAGPIRLPNRDSEPEPDRCVVRGTIRDYEGGHPGPGDIAIVIEVVDSSFSEDRKLADQVYGPSGIPVYWIANLVHRQVELYSDPGPEGYRSRQDFPEGPSVPVVIDGQPPGQVALADVLPSRPAAPNAEGDGA